MKSLLSARETRLNLLLVAAVGCALLLIALWASLPASAAYSVPNSALPSNAPWAMPPANYTNSGLAATSAITCSIIYTTTKDNVGGNTGNDFGNPATLGPYFDLSLVGDIGQYSIPNSKSPFTETFRLDNAVVGATYKIEAVPNQSSNYNLGIIVYDRNRVSIATDINTADFRASQSFLANDIGPFFIKVFQITNQCDGGTYDLTLTYTPPPATATGLPTSTLTPTPSGYAPDQYDTTSPYNDTLANAALLNYGNNPGLTLYNNVLHLGDPGADNDWYAIAGVQGFQYTVNIAPDGAYPAVNVQVFAPDKTSIVAQAYNTNNAVLTWLVTQPGSHYIHVWRAAGSLTNGTYHLNWSSNGPTATPTPTFTPTPGAGTPTDTPVPGLDIFEPNYDFDHAAGIGVNVKYININFVPLPSQSINNDFFKVRVKRGMLVTCETLDLSAGTDTNMILYDDSRNGLAGNDDVDTAHGDLRSRVTVSINYDGYLYILVGQGFAVPNAQSNQYTYSLQCTSGQTGATATPGPATQTPVFAPTWTPAPQAPTPSIVVPTVPPTAMPAISVRPLSTPTPAGPQQQIVTADLRVSYDVNENGLADPGEGVVGLPVRVYDDTTGALLAQGFTDDAGRVLLSVPSAGPIRVIVPYLSFETVVSPAGAAIPVLISPRELPDQIP